MGKEVTWKVFEEERTRREWVELKLPIIGRPLFEHATDYIAELEDGSRVMVRKIDNYVYENGSFDRMASKEDVKHLRKDAVKRSEEKRKRRILY